MKKAILCLVLLFCAASLCACAPSDLPLLNVYEPGEGGYDPVPDAIDHIERSADMPAALYYRYYSEPYLACEWRTVTRTQSKSYELALLEELLAGPGAGSDALMPVFPVGTRVLSTVLSGRTLFVTLSEELLRGYADEPVDWHEYDAWRHEAPLRRRLCIQSIVATVTVNCDVDTVQILVEQKDSVSGSLRLAQSFFLDDSEEGLLTGPISRDDSLLLDLDSTVRYTLMLLSEQNWEKLYRQLAPADTRTGIERPVYQDYLVRAGALPRLSSYEVSPCTLSLDGQEATVQVSGSYTAGNLSTVQLPGRILHMVRIDGLWKISLEQLEGFLEVTP